MLPDLRIVILAVISTFLFTVGVGFYTSSRLTNEPRTARTDTFAALEDTPINRIALNWPAPVPVISSINLDFAINAIGSRNPVRDVTEEARATEPSTAQAAPAIPITPNNRPAEAKAPAMAEAPAKKEDAPPSISIASAPPPLENPATTPAPQSSIVETNDPGAIEPSPPAAPPIVASDRSAQPGLPAIAEAPAKPEELPAQPIAQAATQPAPAETPDVESIPPTAAIETRDPGAIEAPPTQVAAAPQVTPTDNPPVTGSIAQAPQTGPIDDSTQVAPQPADTGKIAARTDAAVEDDEIPLPEARPAEAARPAVKKRAPRKPAVKRVIAAPKALPRVVRRARPRVAPAASAFNNPAFPFNLFQTSPATPN